MHQSNTLARLTPILALLMAAFFCGMQAACSRKEAPPRTAQLSTLRLHTRVIQKISHADPAAAATRYCAYCHGVALQGGAHFEPSCFTCHGIHWQEQSGDLTRAPSDHTIDHKGYMHKPGLFSPNTNCNLCHGADLNGAVVAGSGAPACQLCHTALWLERTPPAG
ncbi:MAG: hypothetical protein NTZ90_13110 [Proteobacteria bacterium]|nr:hypothetical protein [Pseudomonadota bacterium]